MDQKELEAEMIGLKKFPNGKFAYVVPLSFMRARINVATNYDWVDIAY